MFIVDVVGLLTHKGYADELNTRGTLCFKVIKYAPSQRYETHMEKPCKHVIELASSTKNILLKNFSERIFCINEWLYHLNKNIIFGILRVCNTHS